MTAPLKFADFDGAGPRLAYELRWGLKRGLGKIRVVVRWLAEPHADFALVQLSGYASDEVRRWFIESERERCVFDTRSRRFYWPRRVVDQQFKNHETRVQQKGPSNHLP